MSDELKKQVEILTTAQSNALSRAFKAESDLKNAREYADRFLKERNEARDALVNLVAKITIVEESPSYLAVWESAAIHGMNYDGPYYSDELDAARELIKRMK